ncbi:MAG: aldehyde ferredoxin oxidoreductase N-terminal domain-containing protein, partial [Acidobacteriota bacterium]
MAGFSIAGYHGKILNIDLTSGETGVTALDPELVLDYLGGRGLATRIFYDRIEPTSAALEPGNVIVIAASPLIGSDAPTAARGHMVFKSPLTGVIGTSNSGGSWVAGLKGAGYDALVIRGAAREPVYVDVQSDRIEILSAKHLWGKNIHETTAALSAGGEPGNPWRVLCIGPAGENRVRFAAIANDYNRVYGRCGPGAVWGSKNLKAIRIRGKAKAGNADKSQYQSGRDQAFYLLKQAPVTKRLLREFGTAGLIELIDLIN